MIVSDQSQLLRGLVEGDVLVGTHEMKGLCNILLSMFSELRSGWRETFE